VTKTTTVAPAAASIPPAQSASAPSVDEQVKALLPQLEAFVSKTRGLAFQSSVPTTVLPEGAFEAKLASMAPAPTPAEQADAADAEAALQALGLIAPGTDLSKAGQSVQADIDGIYDFQTKQLMVKGTAITPYVRSVLVHELTHALDDQHFDLMRMASMTGNDEKADSFRALSEGDAVRVQLAYINAMSPADRASALADDGGAQSTSTASGAAAAPTGLSDLLAQTVVYPYIAGSMMVRELVAAGGEDYVNKAFASPPTGSMQVLDPTTYLRGIQPVVLDPPLPDPTSGYSVVDSGTFGQFFLALMMQENFDVDTAFAIASTWAGDGYVVMKDPAGNTCVRIEYEADSAQDQPLLFAGLQAWARHHDAAVQYAGVVYLTTCTGGTPKNP